MITNEFAEHFAEEWINAWNARDIHDIMEHYDEQIEFRSPFIVKVNDDPSGRITDKGLLQEYFERALRVYPDLRFTLFKTLVALDSVVLYYKSYRSGTELHAAELMEFNEQGKVKRVLAHYSS